MRVAKDAVLRPDTPGRAEREFIRARNLIERSPVQLQVKGLGPGAGFGLGSQFAWQGPGSHVLSRVWGSVSVNRYYSAGAGLDATGVITRGLNFTLEGSHSDAPELEYYGSGPDSSRVRTDYRREDTLLEVRGTFSRWRYVVPGCRFGQLFLNVGPGTNDDFASTDSVFTPDEAPGVDVQSDYGIAGCSVQADFRDLPGDPHDGSYVSAVYERYDAQDLERFSFHRVSATAEHYIPFLNRKRVIALLARTEFSFHSDEQTVPFYMQSTLGSDLDLRGFRRYRFYDENSIALTGEYRWEVGTGFDMALFADGGKVFHRPGDIALTDLESSVGFGLRFKGRSHVVARLDTGFSHEGFQIWFKFGRAY
jgi:hypothetical protein